MTQEPVKNILLSQGVCQYLYRTTERNCQESIYMAFPSDTILRKMNLKSLASGTIIIHCVT